LERIEEQVRRIAVMQQEQQQWLFRSPAPLELAFCASEAPSQQQRQLAPQARLQQRMQAVQASRVLSPMEQKIMEQPAWTVATPAYHSIAPVPACPRDAGGVGGSVAGPPISYQVQLEAAVQSLTPSGEAPLVEDVDADMHDSAIGQEQEPSLADQTQKLPLHQQEDRKRRKRGNSDVQPSSGRWGKMQGSSSGNVAYHKFGS
jgi:hypothetical protein